MFADNVLKFQSRERENVTRRANGQRRIEKEMKKKVRLGSLYTLPAGCNSRYQDACDGDAARAVLVAGWVGVTSICSALVNLLHSSVWSSKTYYVSLSCPRGCRAMCGRASRATPPDEDHACMKGAGSLD
jgi:hypothetical protein